MTTLLTVYAIFLIYMCVGVMFLCLRTRTVNSFYDVLDPVVWWLPDLLRGRLSGKARRLSFKELIMAVLLAFCIFFGPVSLLVANAQHISYPNTTSQAEKEMKLYLQCKSQTPHRVLKQYPRETCRMYDKELPYTTKKKTFPTVPGSFH